MINRKFIIFLVSFSLLLTGCSYKVEEKDENNSSSDKVQNSNIGDNHINITMVKPKTLNPIINKNQSVSYVLSLVYDSLFTIDENYNIIPQLVKDYSLHSNGLGIDITLKDATWHNGKNVTSEDIEYTIDIIKNNTASPYNVFVNNIERVELNSHKNFTIIFKESYPFSIETLIFPILPKYKLIDKENFDFNLVGSGRYKIEKYEPRKGLYLKPNENYYEDKYIPKNDVKVELVPDEQSQSSMLLSLKSDISSVKLNDLSSFYEEEFNIKKFEGRCYESVIFNYKNEFIQDVNFRRALVSSINRKSILEESYMSNATLVDFPINSKSIYYDDRINTISYSIENAKKYLDNVKIKRNTKDTNNLNKEENIQNNENQESQAFYSKEQTKKMISELDLKIVVNKENTERVKTAYQITKGLKDIGIKSTVKELSGDELDLALTKKEYDLALIGWELSSVPDVTDIIQSIGYTDAKIEGYLNSLKQSSSKEQISSIYKSIQKYVNDNALFVSLVIRDDYIVSNSRLKGNITPNSFDIYDGISNILNLP